MNAQTDVSIRKKDFKNNKPGFGDAWKHIADGDAYFGQKGVWYNDAYNEYLQALVYNSSNAELNYKTGVSALFSDKKEEAAGFFLKALELNKTFFCLPVGHFSIPEDFRRQSGNSLLTSVPRGRKVKRIFCYRGNGFRNALLLRL
jgi:tetratricopeptide (TPR) repeat protein